MQCYVRGEHERQVWFEAISGCIDACSTLAMCPAGPSSNARCSQGQVLFSQARLAYQRCCALWCYILFFHCSINPERSQSLFLSRRSQGQALFSQAMQAYERSCALSDSEAGDDLPGLLHNWGCGLHAAAKRQAAAAARGAALQAAAAKLTAAASFNRGAHLLTDTAFSTRTGVA